MGVLLGIGCYIVCLRLLRWARLPAFHSLLGAGIILIFVYPTIAQAVQNMTSALSGIPIPVFIAIVLLFLGGAALAQDQSRNTYSKPK